jgi:hypothetical protein
MEDIVRVSGAALFGLTHYDFVYAMEPKNVIAGHKASYTAMFAPLLHVHTAHTVRTTEKHYSGRQY